MYNGTTLIPPTMTEAYAADWDSITDVIRRMDEPPAIANIGGFRVAVRTIPGMAPDEWYIAVNGRILAGYMRPRQESTGSEEPK